MEKMKLWEVVMIYGCFGSAFFSASFLFVILIKCFIPRDMPNVYVCFLIGHFRHIFNRFVKSNKFKRFIVEHAKSAKINIHKIFLSG